MPKKNPYTKQTQWLFEVDETEFLVSAFNESEILIEQADFSGHEDCRFFGRLEKIEDKWRLDEDSRKSVSYNYAVCLIDDFEKFFNLHGPPKRRSKKKVKEND